jgi:hypothetical protein
MELAEFFDMVDSQDLSPDQKAFRQERLLAGYLTKDPKKINQTIGRFNYLLKDENSPMLNSLLNDGLIDYVDGSDLPSMSILKE